MSQPPDPLGTTPPEQPQPATYQPPAQPTQPPPAAGPYAQPAAYQQPNPYAQPNPYVPAAGPYPPTAGFPAYQIPAQADPPLSGPPLSGPPLSGPPLSGPPLSGPPLSGPPLSGLPYGVAPAAPKPRRGGVITLAVVAAVLFVVAGLLGGLLVAQGSDARRTRAEIAEQKATLAASTRQIDQLKLDRDAANDAYEQSQQDLKGTKDDRDEQERQKQVVAKCLDGTYKVLTARTQAAFEKALKDSEKICDEADKYR